MFLEQVRNIGEYVLKSNPEENPLDAMVNKIEGDKISSIIEINVASDKITYDIKDFRKDVVIDALFYQKGNGAMGGGIRLDFYKDSKVKSACEFCEISNKYNEIKAIIEDYISIRGNNAFAIILVDGKTPKELFSGKFLSKMYSTMYKELSGKHFCHLCGANDKVFNTTSMKFYTNDKEIYGNVDSKDKSGIVVCGNCLNSIIIGKKHVDETLRTYWSCLESQVMFLPHQYNKEVFKIYNSTKLNDKKDTVKFLDSLRINEQEILEDIGSTNSVTDILFYEEKSKYFYIYGSIQSILPSKFSEISVALKSFDLSLYSLFNYTTAVKITSEEVETSKKEKIRMLDAILHGKKVSRNLFFKRIMAVYKHYYLKGEDKKYACMRTMNRIYSFLCDRKCIDKGCDVMQEYKDYNELFDNNKEYFDTNEKMAWFILGKAYSTMIFFITQKGNDSSGDTARTSLEKNFFYSRKFSFNDFIYFCDLLEDKAIKYSKNYPSFKTMMCEAKEYIGKRESILTQDEAKYVFFWGFNSYFKKDKDVNIQVDASNNNIDGGN